MHINQILKLNNEHESLNTISDFLSLPVSQNDYEHAVLIYLKIATALNLDELAFNESRNYLKTVETNKPTRHREEIYKLLFDLSLRLKDFKNAEAYLYLRKDLLKQMDQYYYLIDKVLYLKALNENYYEVLLELKNEVIPLEIKINVNEEIYKYHLREKNYFEAEKIIKELYDDSLNNKYENELVKLYYLDKKYELVLVKAYELIQNNTHNLYTVVYYISALVNSKNYRRASSIEAEFEHIIDISDDIKLKEFAYNEIIRLYETTHNQFSMDIYKNKLRSLQRKTKKEEIKPVLKEEVKVKEIKTTKILSDAKYLEHFNWINEWHLFSHQIKLNQPFREYLRELFIEIDKKIEFSSVAIYYNESLEQNFFHYKMGRLYDKRVIDFFIENTVISETINNQKSVFGTPEQLVGTKDLLTQKPYTELVKYVYSIYLNDNFVLVFYFDEVLKDPGLYYELLSGIALIIQLRKLDKNVNARLNKESKYLDEIINNPIMPMRRLEAAKSFYNLKAQELFKIDYNLHLELFLREVELDDAKKYQAVIERLFNYPNETNIIKYKFQDLIVLEYLFAVKENENVTIFSYFVNLTKMEETETSLSIKANNDLETGLKNKNYLNDNMNKYLTSKKTFILLELDDSLRNIYGTERMNSYFVEFAQLTKKHFSSSEVIRYDFNQLLVIVSNNDIRAIINVMNNYFSVINNIKSFILKYETFKVKAGLLRYPVSTTEKDINKLYKYLDAALNHSRISNDNYTDFSFDLYEKEVYEQEVIDYLNLAIENKQINLRFKQIINLDKNTVFNYESEIYLPAINIDSKYLINIAKSRNKIVDLEYFHLEMVASFIKEVFDKTGYYINISIPISNETFFDSDFENYIAQIFKKYKVPIRHIKILCDVKLVKQKDILIAERLIKYGIVLETTNTNTALNVNVSALHLNYFDTSKHKKYYELFKLMLEKDNINLIIRNVNKAEARNILKKLNISFIEGELYRKLEAATLMKQIKGNIKQNE